MNWCLSSGFNRKSDLSLIVRFSLFKLSTSSHKGPYLSLDCNGKSFGESVENRETFTVIAEKVPPLSVLEVVFSNGKVIKRGCKRNHLKIVGKAVKGERIHVVTYISLFGKKYITAISNPMWFV